MYIGFRHLYMKKLICAHKKRVKTDRKYIFPQHNIGSATFNQGGGLVRLQFWLLGAHHRGNFKGLPR